MKSNVETFCGGYCGACPQFISTVNGTIDKLAEKWSKPVEEITCYGCKSEQIAKEWCRDCFIKSCCLQNKYETCIECDDYPCKKLVEFQNDKNHPYHSEQPALLELIKNKGKEEWLKECKERWSCKNCHAPYNWYQNKCENCGTSVNGYQIEQNL